MLSMMFRYMWMLFMSIAVWLALPFFASATAFFVYGYLLGCTADSLEINALWQVMSGTVLMVLLCSPMALIMSFIFWITTVVLLGQKRFFSTSSVQYGTAVSFSFLTYAFFCSSPDGWPFSGWLFGIPFAVWGFVLLKGLLKMFSILMQPKERMRCKTPKG